MYSKLLRTIIAEADITQGSLAKKCTELGTPISRGELNRILNRKDKPPDEEISRNIAKICDTDERELVLYGFFDQAPHEFMDFIKKMQDISFEYGFNIIDKNMNLTKKDKDILREIYEKETIVQIILETLDTDDKIEFDGDMFEIYSKKDNINILSDDFTCITMKDDSMEPKLPKGSKLKLEIKTKYDNGDIVLLKVKKEKIVRMIFNIGKDIFIYPLNSKYKGKLLKYNDYQILGRIRSFEVTI